MIGGTINQDVQENKTSDDHTSEDMEFEVMSVSSTEEETPVKRRHSYDEAINLENSSDFCNGQLANIAKELDSSTSIQDSKPQQQGDFQEKGILDSMEIVDLPSGGSVEHVHIEGDGEEGESGNTTKEKTNNLEKLQDNRMDTTNGNTGTGSVECTPIMDISQGGKIGISYETGSESSNKGTISAENVEEPQATPSQNEGAEDEVRDSGTLSTENTLYEPTWSQDGGHEQQVIDALKTLEVRKRKSPDRDIPEVGKKPHMSENQSDGDDNGNKQDHSEEGTGEMEGQNMNDDDEDDNDDDDDNDEDDDDDIDEDDDIGDGRKEEEGNNDGEKSKQNKTKRKQRKKNKLRYQIKKGQLPDKPVDNREDKTKAISLKKAERNAEAEKRAEKQSATDVPKMPDKEVKNEENEKFKSQVIVGSIDIKMTESKQQLSTRDGSTVQKPITSQSTNQESNFGPVQNLNTQGENPKEKV